MKVKNPEKDGKGEDEMSNRHKRRRFSEATEEAAKAVLECADEVFAQTDVKRSVLIKSLETIHSIMQEAGCGDVKMRMSEGSALFLSTPLSDYLDGSEFTAFEGEDGATEYTVVMSLEQDEEDEDSFTSAMTLLKKTGGRTEMLTESGWKTYVPESDYFDDDAFSF